MIAELTKEEQLWEWCKQKGTFSYVDVQGYKNTHFYLRADRSIRDFVTDGKLRRIPLEESILRGLIIKGRAPLAFFEVI